MLQIIQWFPHDAELGPGLQPELIEEFSNSGRDILIALSTKASKQMRALSQNLGIDVDSSSNVVTDHFSFDSKLDSGDHTTIIVPSLAPLPAVFSPQSNGPILYKGIGLSVSPDSEVSFLAIKGNPTTYSGPLGKPATGKVWAGQSLGLVALVQARNNARIAIIGSVDFFSDAFLSASAANNGPVAADILKWAFNEKSVLKSSPLRHRIVGGEESPARYRVNDNVVVEVDIFECSDEDDCKPFK